MAGFVWGGNTGEKMTPQEVDRKRLAAALMAKQAGDTSPVASPFAGINRALQGYISGRDDRRAGAAETAGMAQGKAAMDPVLAALSGGGSYGGQASGGGGSYVASPMTSQPMPAADTGMLGAQGGGSFGLPAADTGGMQGGMDMPPQQSGGLDFGGLEQQYGLPAGYLANVAQIESGGNPNAQNPNSSAGGMFQFIDSTAKQYGVADRFDPTQAANGAARLAADNAASLRKVLGREPTAGELYLAHQQGAGGASKLLSNPDALASAIVGSEAVRLNGGTDNMTAGQFANKWVSKVGGGQATASTMGAPSGGNSDILGLLMQAQADPWAAQQYGPVLEALMGSELQTRQQQADPMYQLGLQKSQLELQQMQNPAAPQPIEVGGVLLDPTTYQPIFDSRQQEAPKAGFRMASPDEAKAYGAGAGQFGPDGRFYAADVPQGMTIESDGAGGFRMVQGPAGADKPFTEAQGKDVVFATRAQGALDALDPVAGELTNRAARAAEYDPTGLARGAMQSDNFQIAKNAGDEFLQALLRKDSGAAITEDEMALYGATYLPKPGDNPKLLDQKKSARARAVAAIQAGMSPAQIVAQEKALGVTPVDGGATDAPPPGVDAETWGFMTPEEKALFQ